MDDVFGSEGLAAADLERQNAINKRLGLDAYDDPSEVHDEHADEKA